MSNETNPFFEYARFLQGERNPEFEEVDSICLTADLLKDSVGQCKVVPLYFYLTRNRGPQMSIASMKKTFKCGADLIQKVKKSIEEKKPIGLPGHKREKPVRHDQNLVGLVDSITRNNGGVSDTELAGLLKTSHASVNRIRHDLKYTYKPLIHAPFLNQRQVECRLLFCQNHLNDDWAQTLFTDESRFATSPDCPIMWWVKKGDKLYASKGKFPFSIMVWGASLARQKRH